MRLRKFTIFGKSAPGKNFISFFFLSFVEFISVNIASLWEAIFQSEDCIKDIACNVKLKKAKISHK